MDDMKMRTYLSLNKVMWSIVAALTAVMIAGCTAGIIAENIPEKTPEKTPANTAYSDAVGNNHTDEDEYVLHFANSDLFTFTANTYGDDAVETGSGFTSADIYIDEGVGEADYVEIENLGDECLSTPRLLYLGMPDIWSVNQMSNDIVSMSHASSGEDVAKALWSYFSEQLFHLCSAGYGAYAAYNPSEFLINYGYGCCDQIAYGLGHLFMAHNMPARVVFFPFHTVTEVFYDDAWHMYDADHDVYYTDEMGGVASVEYIHDHPYIITYDPQPTMIPIMQEGYSQDYWIDQLSQDEITKDLFSYRLCKNESVQIVKDAGWINDVPLYKTDYTLDDMWASAIIDTELYREGMLRQFYEAHQGHRYSSSGFHVDGTKWCMDENVSIGYIKIPVSLSFVVRRSEFDVSLELEGETKIVTYINSKYQESPVKLMESVSDGSSVSFDTGETLDEVGAGGSFDVIIIVDRDQQVQGKVCVRDIQARHYFSVSPVVMPMTSGGEIVFKYRDNSLPEIQRNVVITVDGVSEDVTTPVVE